MLYCSNKYRRKMFTTFSRRVASSSFNASRRMMSGAAHADEIRAEIAKWQKITAGMNLFLLFFVKQL